MPYTVVPPREANPVLPFLNPNPDIKGPFEPCNEPTKNKSPGVKKKKELTLVEEVEEYLRMEATKEKVAMKKIENHPALPYLFLLCNQYQILDKIYKIKNSLQIFFPFVFLIVWCCFA